MFRKSKFPFSKYQNTFHKGIFKNKFNAIIKQNRFKKLSGVKNVDYYNKPARLSHLNQLSSYLKRSINLWSKDRVICTFGKYSGNSEINVEYVESQLTNGNHCIGHYTLKGKKEPYMNEIIRFPNNCLFDVLASQTGVHPNVLRRVVIKEERKKSKGKILKRRLSNSRQFTSALEVWGGARYSGKSEKKAKDILDSSQKGESHPNRQPGHPRGHASYPNATGATDSVENYSKNGWKTGFLSRSDQDRVAHMMLKSIEAQDVMEVLNERGKNANKEAITIRAKDLPANDDDLPKAQEWTNGVKKGEPGRFRDVVLVMKHFYEKYNDEEADVFVLTMYPRL